MAMEVSCSSIWDTILLQTKVAQDKGSDPLLWSIQISSYLSSAGITLPCVELANHLVSHICWQNNVPIAWKFLEKALALKIVPPFLVLGLLSQRVIPYRGSCPAAFRLYLELLKRHAFSLKEYTDLPNYEKTMFSLDEILQLSFLFGLQANEASVLLVLFIFSIVWQLVDAALDDEGLLQLVEMEPRWPVKPQDMEVDNVPGIFEGKRKEYNERLRAVNTVFAIELLGEFLQNKITSRILHLAGQNMCTHWKTFTQRMELLVENSSFLRNSKTIKPEALLQFLSDTERSNHRHFKPSLVQEFHPGLQSRPLINYAGLCLGTSRSALWLPLDMLLEDAMDGSQVNATSAVEIITGLVKSLQATNAASWDEIFLGLWMAALRLVQRERDPIEGPVPRLDTRLSMLLSITTLIVADLVGEEESAAMDEIGYGFGAEHHVPGKRRKDLIFSLQNLQDYQSLLTPPQSVIPSANQAAAKAMMFVSGINASTYFECISTMDMPVNCSGSLYHLIVESCIARNLLDTSAYLWPGYVNGRINQLPRNVPTQVGWSSFMKGAPLTPMMISALVSTPASSFAEIEKIFEIATKGSSDERTAAASVLCGASLIRGWSIQEHILYFITRLLSPPVPVDYSGSESHLIACAPMLNVLLVGISPVDCVQIFSIHGLVPELAGSLMTICEVFGSCVPNISWTLTTGEEISAHVVFSNAFALLLKLWRFNHPPIEYGVGDVPPVGSQLTPEYLLLVRNSYLVSSGNLLKDPNRRRLAQVASSTSSKPIFVDSFPKLKVWYRQHLSCIASPLTGLVNGTPVLHTVDTLLNMMFRNINRGNQTVTIVSSGSSSSSGPGSEDGYLRPKLPAWDILEAVPFVADAALTACAHGRLSPRELCTGLKDLADYLPATLATIVSYFSAEVTRGVWKTVFMNGTDWPSPAANLSNVEEQIKKILAATGVDIPSLAAGGSSPAALPLPLAAFVSLTITYKLDKASQRFLDLAGPALESLAAGCPWPCMPIVASLWTQKAKRWSDFLVFSASRTVFLHSNDAVVQLLRSCFSAILGFNSSSSISSNGGIGALLGHGFGSHFNGGISAVAPGILYLRVHRSIRDIMFLREEIVSLLMQTVQDIVHGGLPGRPNNGKNHGGRSSLAAVLTKVKLAASLGASVVFLTGGLGLVQSLIKETLPSWFMSMNQGGERGGMLPMLRGYALAYLAALSGAFIWGVDSSASSAASKRRPKILGCHMEFVASALDGKISVGCDRATWRAYVSGFLSLVVRCTPTWIQDLDARLLRRLSKGLKRWHEAELALALLGAGGVGVMGSAAELVVESEL
ncbi:mediator of RNA polymerase II transcription subunit 33A-like isoform X1 [Salvia splendens]|uniref:mediator of RNA polymerase II transcription subunit 33A-like isoform X1 n=2 Tax=Salvia splendens TaxID=180675 RepID=UPI001C256A8F|nr:mediator of RNA polymerase II transcription subunit 33A-like isoform X1 [Salvia splendens]